MYQSPEPGTRADAAAEPPPGDAAALLAWGTAALRRGVPTDTPPCREPATAPGDAVREAGLLLAHALGVTRATLLAFSERRPTASERARYAGWIARRLRGEPVAYLLGRREFWSLELEVTPEVLVPRPETELLVERALELAGAAAPAVLDLGTGSGAVALALAAERPQWRITATDVSAAALAVARRNAARLGLGQVEFLSGSWFDPVVDRRFGLIVSNPPYLADDEPALRLPPLGHEPALALAAGPDGLAALLHIAAGAPGRLVPGGWLLLEHGAAQAGAVAERLVALGFGHVRSRRDLAGHERMTEAQWCAS